MLQSAMVLHLRRGDEQTCPKLKLSPMCGTGIIKIETRLKATSLPTCHVLSSRLAACSVQAACLSPVLTSVALALDVWRMSSQKPEH